MDSTLVWHDSLGLILLLAMLMIEISRPSTSHAHEIVAKIVKLLDFAEIFGGFIMGIYVYLFRRSMQTHIRGARIEAYDADVAKDTTADTPDTPSTPTP